MLAGTSVRGARTAEVGTKVIGRRRAPAVAIHRPDHDVAAVDVATFEEYDTATGRPRGRREVLVVAADRHVDALADDPALAALAWRRAGASMVATRWIPRVVVTAENRRAVGAAFLGGTL